MTTPSVELRSTFGDIDIYLFDQLARGRFDGRRRVLDAGCGDGRNLVFFLKNGFTCFGIDRDQAAIAQVRALATRLAPAASPTDFVTGELDDLPWRDGSMDAVIASAVLHFVRDEPHFARIMRELWRVLAPKGLLFARLASTIGLETVLGNVAGTRVRLPYGSDRFVVDLAMLLDWTERLGGHLIDPIKTTDVQGQRCMTTWCVEKRI
jgi:SAM-dependent methyltransferase